MKRSTKMAGFTKTRIVDGNGGGTDLTIASALTALGDNGGTIIVERYDGGNYTIASSLSVPSNTTIIGRGNVVLDVSGSGPAFQNADQQNGNSRIVISGFKINITASGYSYKVIDMKGIDNCIFENLTFSVSGLVSGSQGAIYIGTSIGQTYSTNNIITSCKINNYVYGIFIDSNSGKIIMQDNTITSCTTGCYLINTNDNIISGNVITGSTSDAIKLSSSDYAAINNNQCLSSSYKGIFLNSSSHCAVNGNVCKSNNGSGIYLEGVSGNNSEYNTISGNSCSTNSAGISINAYSRLNTFDGNTSILNSGYGIISTGSGTEKNCVTGNVVYSNASGQISLSGSGNVNANNITT